MSEAVNRIRSPVDEFAAKKEDYILDSTIKIGAGKLADSLLTHSNDCHSKDFWWDQSSDLQQGRYLYQSDIQPWSELVWEPEWLSSDIHIN